MRTPHFRKAQPFLTCITISMMMTITLRCSLLPVLHQYSAHCRCLHLNVPLSSRHRPRNLELFLSFGKLWDWKNMSPRYEKENFNIRTIYGMMSTIPIATNQISHCLEQIVFNVKWVHLRLFVVMWDMISKSKTV